jgi:ribosomal protein L7Ae-like RNA K-turn-binding protein
MLRPGAEPEDEQDRRFLQLVGLARRAGFAVVGTQAVRDAARRGELRVVVVAEDATDNARRRLGSILESAELEVVTRGTRSGLGRAVGRSEVVVVGIRDRGLGLRIVGEVRTTTE